MIYIYTDIMSKMNLPIFNALRVFDIENPTKYQINKVLTALKVLSRQDLLDYDILRDILFYTDNPFILEAFISRAKKLNVLHSDVNIMNKLYGHSTPIMVAFFEEYYRYNKNSLETLKILLKNGATPNSIHYYKNGPETPLSFFALASKGLQNRFDVLGLLIKYGLKANAPKSRSLGNRTPIDFFIHKNRMREAAMLYKAGATPSPKYWCIFTEYLKSNKSIIGNYEKMLSWCDKSISHRLVPIKHCNQETRCEKIGLGSLRSQLISQIGSNPELSASSSSLPPLLLKQKMPTSAYSDFLEYSKRQR